MSFKLFILLIISCAMTPIWGAFKDFFIENKKDLERFGGPNVDMMYNDDFLDEEYYDEESFVICSSYDHYGEINFAEDEKKVIGLPAYEDYIDKNILKQVIQQLVSHPGNEKDNEDLSSPIHLDHYGSSKDFD